MEYVRLVYGCRRHETVLHIVDMPVMSPEKLLEGEVNVCMCSVLIWIGEITHVWNFPPWESYHRKKKTPSLGGMGELKKKKETEYKGW
jgi:hypothetical protein